MNNTTEKLVTENGYIESDIYHFYIKDYQGNNRVVINQDGAQVQANHYYPYGATMGEGLATNTQPYKYGGKELDTMNGLNQYDFGARQQDPALGIFTSIDPLAHKYPSISPYAYCAGNPILYVDPTGKEVREAWNIFKKAFSGNISIGLQISGKIELSNRSVGGNVNLMSAELGNLNNGELKFNSKPTYKQGVDIGVGIMAVGTEKTVEENSDKSATVTTNVSVSAGPLSLENTTKETVKINSTDKNKIVENKSNSSTDLTLGGKAALILGIEGKVDLGAIVESIKELFR